MYSFSEVQNYDPDLAKAMADETQRQRDNIELIASENLVSKAVMAAMGSTLTNKYAEGYPGKRYYGGCEHVDVVEDLAMRQSNEALWMYLCKCSATFRCTGKYDCILCTLCSRVIHLWE